ncbi:MAG: AEC family transporter [Ignavibacteriales bacterium]|nr:AEC family transporter [Ignavibacteriales bacterium]
MNFFLIFLCLAAGFFLRRSNIIPAETHTSVNAWILYVALPSVALHYIPSIDWSSEVILPFIMPLIVWCGAWMVVTIASRVMHISSHTRAALILTAGLGNTSFVGFPLTQAYFGDSGLRIAVMCDQMSFVMLSSFGIVTAMHAAHAGNVNAKVLLKKILLFPPFIGFITALVLPRFISLAPVDPLFESLSLTLVPLALFSVGLQVRFTEWRSDASLLSLGLAYKLLIAPTIVLGAALLFQFSGITAQASIFEASMPPMITAAILATQYGLNPALANRMVSIGLVLSFATTAVWCVVVGTTP